MDKYKYFSLQELVWDDLFREWVLSPTPELNSKWHQWLSDNPEKWDIIQDAGVIVKAIKVEEPSISQQEIRSLIQKTVHQIERNKVDFVRESVSNKMPLKMAFFRQFWFKMAASVILFIGLGCWGWIAYSRQQTDNVYETFVTDNKSKLIEVINKGVEPQIILLNDGSKVTLKEGSRMSYEASFSGNSRIVYLTGEAFFEVVRNPQKPFLVYANELVTKVLGTSFTVKAHQFDKNVVVEVRTGKVSVSAQKGKNEKEVKFNGLILTPNQKVIYYRQVSLLTKSLVSEPVIVLKESEVQEVDFNFDDKPANEVFEVLEKAYGIHIIFDADLLKNCPVTAPLSDQNLYNKLKIICKAIEAQYELIDGQIIIQSKGCK